jgi:hypothetical protein
MAEYWKGPSFLLGWVLQSVVVYFGPLILVIFLSTWLSAPDSVTWQILDYVIFGLSGMTMALVVSGIMATTDNAGRWVWTLPVILLICNVAWDTFHGDVNSFRNAFLGTGEAGWVKGLLTLPAWASCCYSATMAWHRHRQNHVSMEAAIGL